ncbi:MAG: hypothetical protein ABI890_10295 [Lapillicoccus sp.]
MDIHLHHETLGTLDDWVDTALAGADPDRTGVIVARALGHTREGVAASVLTFLPSSSGPQDFAVVETQLGTDPGPARFVQLTRFEGPRSAEWVEAEERATRERVWPAVQGVPGFVAAFRCRAVDGDTLSIVLATSVEALQEGGRRIRATELLPGEDPAMLTGPDRVEILQLHHIELPQSASATAEVA